MLIVVALALLAVATILCIIKRDRESFYVFGLCVSLAVFLLTICMFIAKRGGFSDQLKILLFLSKSVNLYLRYFVITLKSMGYLMAVGRYLFPYFFLLLAMHYSMIGFVRKRRWLPVVAGILPVVSLIIYAPHVFEWLAGRPEQSLLPVIVACARVWVFIYVAVGVFLLGYELYSISIRVCRTQFSQKVLFLISLAALYLLFFQQDPAQVYLFYRNNFMSLLALWYLSPQLNIVKYIVALVFTLLCGVIGFTALLRFTQLHYREGQDDVVMRRKFDAAHKGASVFVHSVKNQLLSNKVIYKRLASLHEQPGYDETSVWNYINRLEDANSIMLQRMEELYSSVKSKSIYLHPTDAEDVIGLAVEKFKRKYPEGKVTLSIPGPATVLADKRHLSEAVYNLLTNAWEATLQAGRSKSVELALHLERLYTVIEVQDYGIGIEKAMMTKIFEPFYSNKNVNYNWGMGLYYMRTIVKSHLGRLRIESQHGEGTSFFILLPRYSAPIDGGRK